MNRQTKQWLKDVVLPLTALIILSIIVGVLNTQELHQIGMVR